MIEIIAKFWDLDSKSKFSHLETRLFFCMLHEFNKNDSCTGIHIHSRELLNRVGTKLKNLNSAIECLTNRELIEFEKGTTRKPNLYKPGKALTDYYQTGNNKDSIPIKKEAIKNDSYHKGSNQKKRFNLDFAKPEFQPLIQEFIEYRKELKKPYKTDRGVKQFYNQLINLSGGSTIKARKIIDYAYSREWQSVFPIPGSNKSTIKEKFRNESVIEYTNSL